MSAKAKPYLLDTSALLTLIENEEVAVGRLGRTQTAGARADDAGGAVGIFGIGRDTGLRHGLDGRNAGQLGVAVSMRQGFVADARQLLLDVEILHLRGDVDVEILEVEARGASQRVASRYSSKITGREAAAMGRSQ